MGDKPAYLINSYSVSKVMTRGMSMGYPPLGFKDAKGNVVLTAKQGGIGRHAVLADGSGNMVGYVQKKGISLGNSATYQFFDGKNQQIGQVKIRAGLMGMSETISMQDPNGNAVASATGNFAGFNYEVMDAEGKKTLAKIYRNTGGQNQQGGGGGLGGLLKQAAGAMISQAMGSYNVEILDKSINDLSRLFILELVVVLDTMYQPNSGGFSSGGGMGPGGGGFNIKI